MSITSSPLSLWCDLVIEVLDPLVVLLPTDCLCGSLITGYEATLLPYSIFLSGTPSFTPVPTSRNWMETPWCWVFAWDYHLRLWATIWTPLSACQVSTQVARSLPRVHLSVAWGYPLLSHKLCFLFQGILLKLSIAEWNLDLGSPLDRAYLSNSKRSCPRVLVPTHASGIWKLIQKGGENILDTWKEKV